MRIRCHDVLFRSHIVIRPNGDVWLGCVRTHAMLLRIMAFGGRDEEWVLLIFWGALVVVCDVGMGDDGGGSGSRGEGGEVVV